MAREVVNTRLTPAKNPQEARNMPPDSLHPLIEREIGIPEGYALSGVATWKKTLRNTEFFIRNVQTVRIHSCRVRTLAGVPLGEGRGKRPPKPPDRSPESLQSVALSPE